MTTSLAEAAVRGTGARDPRPWGIYGRISKRTKGDGRGAFVKIADQQSQGADYVRAKCDPDASFVYYEDNMSAWDPDVTRDGYEAMQEDVRNGRLAGTVAWHVDRFTRQPAQMERQFDDARKGRAELHTIHSGQVESKLMIRILMAVGAEESDQKSRRLRNHHALIASKGKPSGGTRPFGYRYENGGLVIVPEEAAIVEELAARVIEGVPLRKLERWLIAEGIPTASGSGVWRGPNIGKMLRRPLYAGTRVHKKVEYPASWPAILDATTHANVLDVLNNPERVNHAGNARVYVLSNLAVCDVCEQPLKGVHRAHGQRKVVRNYNCRTGRHVYRPVELVDAAVNALMIERLSRMDASGALVDDTAADRVVALERELSVIASKLAEHTARNFDGRMSDDQLERSTAEAERRSALVRRDLTEARLDAGRPERVLAGMTGPGAEEAWTKAELDRKRAVIAFLCERIALKSAGGRERREFNPRTDVVVKWRKRTK